MPNLNKYPKKNATKVTRHLESRVKRWIPGLPIPIYNSEPIKRNPPRALAQPTERFEDTLATPSSNASLNATQLALGFTTITSTVTSLISQSFNGSGKLLISDMEYNTTLPALSTESTELTEQFNNTLSTANSDLYSYAAAGGLLAVPIIIATIMICRVFFQGINKKESENSYSKTESVDNLGEAEKGLLPIGSSTPKTPTQQQQVSLMLAESAKSEVSKKTNRNRHQFYKSLPASNASSYEKGNDHDTPRSSNS